jgi:hypothetical protein
MKNLVAARQSIGCSVVRWITVGAITEAILSPLHSFADSEIRRQFIPILDDYGGG